MRLAVFVAIADEYQDYREATTDVYPDFREQCGCSRLYRWLRSKSLPPKHVGTSVPINYEGGRIASHRATRKLSIRSLGRDFQRGYRLHDRGRLGPIKHAVESREAPDIFIRQCIPQSCRIHNWCRTETCRLPHAEPKLPRTTRCIHLVGIDRATRQPRVGRLFGSSSHQLPRQSLIL